MNEIAEHHIDKKISTVTVMDTDIREIVRNYELVPTTRDL